MFDVINIFQRNYVEIMCMDVLSAEAGFEITLYCNINITRTPTTCTFENRNVIPYNLKLLKLKKKRLYYLFVCII